MIKKSIKYFKKSSIVIIGLFLFTFSGKTQGFLDKSDTLNLFRQKIAHGTNLTVGVGSLTGLSILWYSNSAQSSFHFFNDATDWRVMDKLGHSFTSYQLTKYTNQTFEWAGYSDSKALKYALFYSLGYLTIIEVLDGFSEGWGASLPDITANLTGSVLYYLHQNSSILGINLKLSYFPSIYAQYRPELLGSNTVEKIFKDYNAQNYWFSFYDKQSKILPPWLGFSFGYGAIGMLGGSKNPIENKAGDELPNFERLSRYSFSLDIHLDQIKTNSKWLKNMFNLMSIIKVPFPTFSIYSDGTQQFYWYR